MGRAYIFLGVGLVILALGGALSSRPLSLNSRDAVVHVTGTDKDRVHLWLQNPSLVPVNITAAGCGCGTQFTFPEGDTVPPLGRKPVIAEIRGATLSHGEHFMNITLGIKRGAETTTVKCPVTVWVDRREN